MNQRPNIILLMCDQFRGDCLSFFDHPDVKTPYLDTLASDGITFDQAYTVCPSCIAARAGLFTGKSPEHTGRVGYQDKCEWKYDHMLASQIRDAGYQTACIGKMHVHPPRLSCGFEVLKLHDGYIGTYRHWNLPYWMHQACSDDYMRDMRNILGSDFDVNGTGVENNSWITHPWVYEEKYHPTNWVVDQSIRFLETRDRTRPFFMMSSFVRPHPPFDAPASYFDMYKDADLRPPAQGDWMDREATMRDGKIMDSPHGCSDEKMRHDAMAGYYASIPHVDHQIGRLITSLENDESYHNSIIIFTSDHGELLFDHGLFRKTRAYEGSTKIPFIIHVGKEVAGTIPHISHSIVELRDIYPTIMDFIHADTPKDVDGCSLAGECLSQTPIERTYLHGEHSADFEQSNQWIRMKDYKYVWHTQSGIEQFFDIKNDPRELKNLMNVPEYADAVKECRDILIDVLKDREEGYSDGSKLITGCKPKSVLDIALAPQPEVK